MFIYNVHAPSKTFALPYTEGETCAQLVQRLADKSGLGKVKAVYEYDGQRWSLEDDDDLRILHDRIPPSSSGTTLHVSPLSPGSQPAPASAPTSAASAPRARTVSTQRPTGDSSHAKPAHGAEPGGANGNGHAAPAGKAGKAKSMMSTRTTWTHRSKWGNDDAEPLGETKRREWEAFHANNGVRTVVGEVAGLPNVRMLLKQGHKGVYISRQFAVKSKLISSKHLPGVAGYSGLVALGSVPITVAGRTLSHPAMLSEEQHFDVILGRQWVERSLVKVDPIDPTHLTYMDTGEVIPCDLVVLRDAAGEIITVT